MTRPPPRSTLSSSSAASDVYKRQVSTQSTGVTIEGDGPGTVVSVEGLVVSATGGSCTLRRLHLTAGEGCLESVVHMVGYQLELDDCEISGGLIGLVVAHNAKVRAVNCRFVGAGYAGICVDVGSLELVHCSIIQPQVLWVRENLTKLKWCSRHSGWC
eukprot:TRINITY_DN23412_c0_g1_i2.p1 TRINITY_DN23412_c0_g1~~TRINITY_DN23412_c0_g1_i2.p1  ORF type:complete len:158 (-),score=36.23 TRINITY_DN23412_c0_g1_i2:802-1275(-)